MNNILSGTKYRVSPEEVSLMDETNNLVSHLERSPLIHSYGYEYYGRPALGPLGSLRSCKFAPGKFVRGRSSNLLNQLAHKFQILHAICGLVSAGKGFNTLMNASFSGHVPDYVR